MPKFGDVLKPKKNRGFSSEAPYPSRLLFVAPDHGLPLAWTDDHKGEHVVWYFFPELWEVCDEHEIPVR